MYQDKINKNALKVLEILESNGYEAYIVGGAVRDLLLGLEPKDWDITTNAEPMKMYNMFDKVIPTGEQFGTMTVVVNEELIEITTYREDLKYEDGRRPTIKFAKTLKEDLSRRDFTINGMAMSKDAIITDLFGGQNDIENGILRTIGKPEDRFNEDKLRKLRAIRFAAQKGLAIHKETLMAIMNDNNLIGVSPERVNEELTKLLNCSGDSIFYGLSLLEMTGMIDEKIFYSKSMFPTLNALSKGLGVLDYKYINLAFMLLGNEIFEEFLIKYRYSNKEISYVKDLIELSGELDNYYFEGRSKFQNYPYMKEWLRRFGYDKLVCSILMRIAHHRHFLDLKEVTKYEKIMMAIIQKAEKVFVNNEPIDICDLDITGLDIMKLGAKGQEIGRCLEVLLHEAYLKPEINNKKNLNNRAGKILKNFREMESDTDEFCESII